MFSNFPGLTRLICNSSDTSIFGGVMLDFLVSIWEFPNRHLIPCIAVWYLLTLDYPS